MKLLDKLSISPFNSDEIDGIKFTDVKNIVKSKEDLENILLSTKIIIENKEQMLELFQMLLDYGFKESAINYFEDISSKMNDYELIDGFNTLLK